MIIKTEPFASRLGAKEIACHVEGKLENNVNWAEVDAVEALIEELLGVGYCLNSLNSDNTIGVISPYRRQVNALTQRLQSRWSDFSSKSIGTIHSFQGGQKSVIIFSTRQCQSTDSLWFINRRPNLLNVAVSRARELFILVGNLGRISEGGIPEIWWSILRNLVKCDNFNHYLLFFKIYKQSLLIFDTIIIERCVCIEIFSVFANF
jgi:superfamily I DNA and/or RNA helicase